MIWEVNNLYAIAVHLSTADLDALTLYNRLTRNMYLESSDFSFVNLLIWRHAHQLRYAVDNGFFIPYCNYKGNVFFMTAAGGPREEFVTLCDKLAAYSRSCGHPFKMMTVPEEIACLLLEEASGRYKIIPDHGNWDYLYNTRDLLELKGRKYQQKESNQQVSKTIQVRIHSFASAARAGEISVSTF